MAIMVITAHRSKLMAPDELLSMFAHTPRGHGDVVFLAGLHFRKLYRTVCFEVTVTDWDP